MAWPGFFVGVNGSEYCRRPGRRNRLPLPLAASDGGECSPAAVVKKASDCGIFMRCISSCPSCRMISTSLSQSATYPNRFAESSAKLSDFPHLSTSCASYCNLSCTPISSTTLRKLGSCVENAEASGFHGIQEVRGSNPLRSTCSAGHIRRFFFAVDQNSSSGRT